MPNEFHNVEESLKKFLLNAVSDNYNARNTNMAKYNNLKIFIQPAKFSSPHFCVTIGISEGVFDLATGDKISGGLGTDERLIRRWLDRSFVRDDLRSAWKKVKKHKSKSVIDEDYDD